MTNELEVVGAAGTGEPAGNRRRAPLAWPFAVAIDVSITGLLTRQLIREVLQGFVSFVTEGQTVGTSGL